MTLSVALADQKFCWTTRPEIRSSSSSLHADAQAKILWSRKCEKRSWRKCWQSKTVSTRVDGCKDAARAAAPHDSGNAIGFDDPITRSRRSPDLCTVALARGKTQPRAPPPQHANTGRAGDPGGCAPRYSIVRIRMSYLTLL